MLSSGSCFYHLCLPPHVPVSQGHVVFDASGSRMAWTLIEQLQGECRGVGQSWGAELGWGAPPQVASAVSPGLPASFPSSSVYVIIAAESLERVCGLR